LQRFEPLYDGHDGCQGFSLVIHCSPL
jgi:hypothetical protein